MASARCCARWAQRLMSLERWPRGRRERSRTKVSHQQRYIKGTCSGAAACGLLGSVRSVQFQSTPRSSCRVSHRGHGTARQDAPLMRCDCAPTVQPNLAWAPVKAGLGTGAPTKGQLVPAPAVATRLLKMKEVVVPVKHESSFIAMNANVLGDVKLGPNSSVWYGAVLRGEAARLLPRSLLLGTLPDWRMGKPQVAA
jgi:hypothetical protein